MKNKRIYLWLVFFFIMMVICGIKSMKVHASSILASGTCGESATWRLDSDYTLTVAGSGRMDDYKESSTNQSPWSKYVNDIKKVVIQTGISNVGNNAFSYCQNIKDVELQQGVQVIGEYSFFMRGRALESVTLPDSIRVIGKEAFANCYRLENINFPNKIMSIGAFAFEYCSLGNVSIASGTISNNAFANNKTLTNVYIGSDVTSISSDAFLECTALESINVNLENESYSSVEGVLFDKKKLMLLRFPPANTLTSYTMPDEVITISKSAFEGCSNLKTVKMSDNISSIKPFAFYGCQKLSNIQLSRRITEISASAFYNCSNLSSITIPNRVTSIGSYAFWNCSSLQTVYFGGNAPTIENINAFSLVNATIYIPENDSTWTEDIKDKFTGNVTWINYKPDLLSVSSWTVNVEESCTYDGDVQCPLVYVQDGAVDMKAGVDYTITYDNNVLPGLGSVIITGCGDYTGTITKNFAIKKGTLEAVVQPYSGVWDGNPHSCSDPKITAATDVKTLIYYSTVKELTETDYQTSGILAKPDRSKPGETKVYYYVTDVNGYYEPAIGNTTISIKATSNATKFNGTYDGKPHSPVIEGCEGTTLYYSTSSALNYSNYTSKGTTTLPGRTGAGKTTVYYIAVPDSNATETSVDSGQTTITLDKGEQSVTAEISSDHLTEGAKGQISASSTAGRLSYSSSNSEIVSVDEEGVVTAISEGSAEITITAASTANYNEAKKVISIEVTPVLERSISGCSVSSIPDYIYIGNEIEPKLTIKDGDYTLRENTDYTLKYTNNINAGTARISISGKGTYVGSTIKEFTINKAYQNFQVGTASNTLKVGSSVKITLTGNIYGDVSYASADRKIASVSRDGLVTGVSTGIVNITISASETENYLEAMKTISLTVEGDTIQKKSIKECELILSDTSYIYDGTEKKPKVMVKDGGVVLIEGEDYKVTYPENMVDSGILAIKVTGADIYDETKELTYEILPTKPSLSFAEKSVTKRIDDGTFVNTLEAATDGEIIYSSSDESVAKVSTGSGEVSIIGTGTATITANASHGRNYQSGSTSFLLMVTQGNKKKLSIDDFSYSFENTPGYWKYKEQSREENRNIRYTILKRMFGTAKANTIYVALFQGKEWKGNCAGFSGTAALLADPGSGISVKDFNSSAIAGLRLYDENYRSQSFNMDVKDFIESMQVGQFSQIFQRQIMLHRIHTDEHINKGKGNLNTFYQDVKKETDQGRPVLLALVQKPGYGHAVLAYATEDENAPKDEAWILLYDSNHALDERKLVLKRNEKGDFTKWEYEHGLGSGVWGTDEPESFISYVPYETIKQIWNSRGNLKEDENIFKSNSSSLAIYDKNNDLIALIADGQLTFTKDKNIYVIENLWIDKDKEDELMLSMPVDTYKFENQDEKKKEFEVSVVNNYLGISVSTTAENMTLTVDDTRRLNTASIYAAKGDTYSVTLNSFLNSENNSVVLTGTGTGKVAEVSQSKGIFNFINCDIKSLSSDGEVIPMYQIKASADPGGTIDPMGKITLLKGNSQTYTIKANTGYVISDVLVDGKSVGAVPSYTFNNISASHNIEAKFTKPENKIRADDVTLTSSSKPKNMKLQIGVLGDAKLTFTSSNKAVKISSDGTLTVPKNFVGESRITIRSGATADYSAAAKTITITVNPTGTVLKKLSAKGTGTFLVTWKKNSKVAGYQICYSTSAKFKKSKIKTIKKNKVVKATLKGKKKKSYYVRIRTYKTVAGKKYYSAWSKKKVVRVR